VAGTLLRPGAAGPRTRRAPPVSGAPDTPPLPHRTARRGRFRRRTRFPPQAPSPTGPLSGTLLPYGRTRAAATGNAQEGPMERRALLTTAVALTATACTGPAGGPPPRTGAPASTTAPPGRPAPEAAPSGRPPAATTRTPTWKALAGSVDGRLITPDDADWSTARQLYNPRFDGLRPAAVVYVAGEGDIAECLAWARRRRIPVAIRSGGHSYAGWSSGDGRLVIDVSRLHGIAVDGPGGAVIGAGARLIDVYGTLARSGRTLPAGSCPSVGVSGLALGGGHGVTSRAYGLTCDSLTSATLVTADGRTLSTGPDDHPDLHWALRGAGNGNFGVVTALRFRTHPAPPGVIGRLGWPWARAEQALRAWQRWGPDQPDEIWSGARLTARGGGSPSFSVSLFSLGTESDLRNAVDRLAGAAGSPASFVSLRRTGFADAMLEFAGCSSYGDEECVLPGRTPGRSAAGGLARDTYAAASAFYDRLLPDSGIRALLAAVESFTRLPDSRGEGSVLLTALGGAVNRVDPLATAFVHRRSRLLAQFIAGRLAGTRGGPERAWLARTHRALRRYGSGAAYQNYTDPYLTDWRRAYYGPAADRLTEVKRRYDPDRIFDFPQAV
jgi:FAD/FMN-containing dehydrogenase